MAVVARSTATTRHKCSLKCRAGGCISSPNFTIIQLQSRDNLVVTTMPPEITRLMN